MLNGIDISNHNYHYLQTRGFSDIQNADFVIMKASEGVTYKDPALDKYYDIVHGSGNGRPDPEKLYGFYHYARPENYNDPVREAEHFLSFVGHHVGHALFVVDVEGQAFNLSEEYINVWTGIWCNTIIKKTGVKPLVYCSLNRSGVFKDAAAMGCGLWSASWGRKPLKKDIKPWPVWALWQDGTSGGKLDTDKFNGTARQFRMYCGQAD